jgi:hypothetical protein
MAISIALKSFACPPKQVLTAIDQMDNAFVGTRVQSLKNFLPDAVDLKAVKDYDGDLALLGDAESFLLQLLDVSAMHVYALCRVETILG